MTNLKNLAESNGMNFENDTVKNTIYLLDMADFAQVNEAYKTFFPSGRYPARTCIAIKELPKPEYRVEIESVLFRRPKQGN